MSPKRRGDRQTFYVVHPTEDGPVHLEVVKWEGGGWKARFWGRELDGFRRCKTLAQARHFLLRRLADMYPWHRCTERCGPLGRAETLQPAGSPAKKGRPRVCRQRGVKSP
jgi:hypothetical protein